MDDLAPQIAAITADVRRFLLTLSGDAAFNTEDGRADAGGRFLRWRFGREDAEAGLTHAHIGGARYPLPPFWAAWNDALDDLVEERGDWRRGTRFTLADALACLDRVVPFYPEDARAWCVPAWGRPSTVAGT